MSPTTNPTPPHTHLPPLEPAALSPPLMGGGNCNPGRDLGSAEGPAFADDEGLVGSAPEPCAAVHRHEQALPQQRSCAKGGYGGITCPCFEGGGEGGDERREYETTTKKRTACAPNLKRECTARTLAVLLASAKFHWIDEISGKFEDRGAIATQI